MTSSAPNGWDGSAAAWLAEQGEAGDFGRRCVLDGPMLARLRGRGFRAALDIGCGEGRFCRLMRAEGIRAVGIDPTETLLAEARRRDPGGDYRIGRAEDLDVPAGSFDLVVSYLTLIDIADLAGAIAAMVAALRPGGTLLIANLTSFNTAGQPDGWVPDGDGVPRFRIDHYQEERSYWAEWRGIRIVNWHRPLGTYLGLLLGHGLILRHFSEPVPEAGDPRRIALHRRVPFFHVMEWEKPPG
ncbi:class I SAM-dependent methyltransferase [Methylobacterium sp. ID0610]|uniref:class I SAM-dependent methyltransferase n=1 Tax=Methylobacterium carpenticola TaxID=3344827 RepID=UPI0036C29203